MADLDELAQRAVAGVSLLAARAARLAGGVALGVGGVGVVVYLLGLAALEGGARSAWLVVGAALVAIAAGAPLLARWRLSSVRRNATALVGDVRTLVERNTDARRVVIDAVEHQDQHGPSSPATFVRSQRFTSLHQLAGTANDLRTLPSALLAVTTFPGLLAISLAFLPVFFILGLIYLIAWAF